MALASVKLNRSTVDAINLLKAGHETVSSLFEELKRAHDEERKESIVVEICETLRVHVQIEEEIFYPTARAALDVDARLINEADIAHSAIKFLVTRVEECGIGYEHFDTLLNVLAGYVQHHVQVEERDVFPMVAASSIDLRSLGLRMERRKLELEALDQETCVP